MAAAAKSSHAARCSWTRWCFDTRLFLAPSRPPFRSSTFPNLQQPNPSRASAAPPARSSPRCSCGKSSWLQARQGKAAKDSSDFTDYQQQHHISTQNTGGDDCTPYNHGHSGSRVLLRRQATPLPNMTAALSKVIPTTHGAMQPSALLHTACDKGAGSCMVPDHLRRLTGSTLALLVHKLCR